jgi:hypothetical protein
VSLRLLPRAHFTGCPSPKRYDNRYEVQGRENSVKRKFNFGEFLFHALR